MGPMNCLVDAVCWSGTDATLSMFVISPNAKIPPFEPADIGVSPDHLRTYKLDDELGVLRGRHAYEYDLAWEEMPDDPEGVVTNCLVAAWKQGAVVAWFGFEGSFDFEYLLHPDVATQIYAVAAGDVVRLALDDEYRVSSDWRDLLVELRERVLR